MRSASDLNPEDGLVSRLENPDSSPVRGRASRWRHPLAGLWPMPAVFIAASLIFSQPRLDLRILEKFQQGRFQEASVLARRALERDGSNAVYQELYGMVLAALGKNEEAEKHLRRAVELRPRQAEFHYNLAQFLLDRQEASGLHPFDPRARRLMEDAISALKRVLELSPGNVEARMSLARSYNNLNFSEMALNEYSTVAAGEPNRPWLNFQMGMLHSNLADPVKAVASFRREIDLYPDHARARLELAEILLQQGNVEEATRHLLRTEPGLDDTLKHRVYFLLAKAHRNLGHVEDALMAVHRSIDLCSTFIAPNYLLAQLYRETGQLDLARRTLERVERLRSEDSSSADPFAFREGHCPGRDR